MKITSLEPLVVDIGPRNWLFVVVETDLAIRARLQRRSRSIASTSSARIRRGSSTSGS
jgi:hypothetical protein